MRELNIRPEALHAELLTSWLNLIQKQGKLLFFHVPNETNAKVSVKALAKRARQGVKKGVPDYFVFLKNGKTIAIELKHEKGRLSTAQQEWLENLNKFGVQAVVAYGFNEAKEILKKAINEEI